MKHVLSGFILGSIALVSACAPMQPAPVAYPPFPESEYAKLQKTGDATVTGQVFMKTRGGDVKVGAGSEILLIPVTSYSRVFYSAYLADRPVSNHDERVKAYTIRTQADGTGSFRFKNVPPGKYYLTGDVVWEAPTRYGMTRQGGLIAKEIAVEPGSESNVMLTK